MNVFQALVDKKGEHRYVEEAVVENIIASSILKIHSVLLFRGFLVH
jgi:hypothetical protein